MRMRMFRPGIVVALIFSVSANAQDSRPQQPTFEPADLPFEVPEDAPVVFGYLRVPEVRSDPDSRWIEVPVAILKSRSANPAPDPLIHLIGGPGSSHLTSARYGEYIPYLDDRDDIIFEQRGTRYARPALDCPDWDEAKLRNALEENDSAAATARLVAAALACLDRGREEGVDLAGYRTTEIAADVEDFRRLMGYESYNILAVSYGTKVAQVLMRDHPAAIRSVILDSALPLSVNWEEESLASRDAVLARIFADCAADAACKAAFPDLEARFWAAIRHFNEEPFAVTARHADSDQEIAVQVTGRRLLGLLVTGDTATLPYVPLYADAIARRDVDALAPFFEDLAFESGYAMGMRMACWCAEEVPFTDYARVAQLGAEHPRFQGVGSIIIDPAVCEALQLPPATAIENEPVRSDLPVLLINGGYDAATPTRWARRMLDDLPNATLIEFPGWGHALTSYWNEPCAQALVVEFLRRPGVRPEAPCFEDLAPVRFVLE